MNSKFFLYCQICYFQATCSKAALSGSQVLCIFWNIFVFFKYVQSAFHSDDDFLPAPPKKKTSAPSPPLHPILGSRTFPSFSEGPLSVMEKLPSKQKHSSINNKVRLAIKAVRPGHYGKGLNPHWAKMVSSKHLKSSTSRAVVGNISSFSLAMFLPWEKVPSDFNKGPESGDYLIPGISWAKFKVVILMFCWILIIFQNSSWIIYVELC